LHTGKRKKKKMDGTALVATHSPTGEQAEFHSREICRDLEKWYGKKSGMEKKRLTD